jgi:uncharacterized protein YegJ (DUF2314 family)
MTGGGMPMRTGRLAGLALIAAFVWLSCGPGERDEGLNPIIQTEENDPVLRAIALSARESLSEFTRKLQNPSDGEYNFQVKYPFACDPDSGYAYEHLWLRDIEFRDGKFLGTLANSPFYVQNLSLGGRVEFFLDDISDWMYMKQDRIQGGKSIKYLIEKIPPAERDERMRQYLEFFE